MKMMRWVLTAGALVLAASLTYTSAYTQDASGTAKKQAKPAESATTKPDESTKPKRAARGRSALKIEADSLASRTSMNRQDCKPNNLKKDGLGMHGHYRTYGQWDPELKSIEGRRQFEACVKRGLEPTPWFAFGQRMMISSGGKFFGRGRDDCLKCHSKY
jgi:hypothetical protein